jgi:dihydrofolate reductase
MSEIIIIAAVAENNVIGRGLDIPWYISDDFKRFKELTMGWPVIMGSRTYDSLPVKPLPGRENIVLSRREHYAAEGVVVKSSLAEAVRYCAGKEKVFIIGGANVYEQAIGMADTMELTRIGREFPGDAYFPAFNPLEWDLSSRIDRSDPQYGSYSFLTYRRKK